MAAIKPICDRVEITRVANGYEVVPIKGSNFAGRTASDISVAESWKGACAIAYIMMGDPTNE